MMEWKSRKKKVREVRRWIQSCCYINVGGWSRTSEAARSKEKKKNWRKKTELRTRLQERRKIEHIKIRKLSNKHDLKKRKKNEDQNWATKKNLFNFSASLKDWSGIRRFKAIKRKKCFIPHGVAYFCFNINQNWGTLLNIIYLQNCLKKNHGNLSSEAKAENEIPRPDPRFS